MRTRFDAIARAYIARESIGPTDEADPRGGPRRLGVLGCTYEAWERSRGRYGRRLDEMDVTTALAYLEARIWNEGLCLAVPEAVRELYFDAAALYGVRRAVLLFERSEPLAASGVQNTEVFDALHRQPARQVRCEYIRARYHWLGEIASRDGTRAAVVTAQLERLRAVIGDD